MTRSTPAGGRLQRLVAHDYFPIAVLLTINIIIGMFIFTDYGESWDEMLRFRYGERSLTAYTGADVRLVDEKGAFYVMLARLGSDAVRMIDSSLYPIEAWHIIHFLSFSLGLFFFYKLCLRYFGKWGAFGTTLLFNTQPLLWGHAFINPKDIPFMAFFLGSVSLGMDMVDRISPSLPARITVPGWFPDLKSALRQDWQALSVRRRVFLGGVVGIAFGVLLGLVLFAGAIQAWVASLIHSAYDPASTGLLSRLFSRLAENRLAVPVDFYIQKATALYPRLILLYLGLLLGLLLLLWITQFPSAASLAWRAVIKPLLSRVGRSLVNPYVIAAAIFLGLSTSIRILGPASAMLVGAYFLLKSRWRSLPVLAAYAAIAMLVTYLTWPYLWGAPFEGLFGSASTASDFPWEGKVLFAGVEYPASSLPRTYLPVLMALQTPEITLLLFFFGLAVIGYGIATKKADWIEWLIPALWFFAPFLAVIVRNQTMYDNFRQFIFILPGAFLFVGAGLQWILDRIRNRTLAALLILALALPNLITLTRLHPYQYAYYNSLAGGQAGAFRRFDTDYWATSYKEAAEYLNANAPQGSLVVVVGPDHIVDHYARPDLVIQEYSKRNPVGKDEPFYAVLLSRHNKDQTLFPEGEPIHSIGRQGAVYAVIKRVNP